MSEDLRKLLKQQQIKDFAIELNKKRIGRISNLMKGDPLSTSKRGKRILRLCALVKDFENEQYPNFSSREDYKSRKIYKWIKRIKNESL